jgi:hypothetical protein
MVWLVGAKIGGNLECEAATFSNREGEALVVAAAEIGGDVALGFGSARGIPARLRVMGKVSLDGTTIRGSVVCSGADLVGNSEDEGVLSAIGTVVDRSLVLRASEIRGVADFSGAKVLTLDDDVGQGTKELGSWEEAKLVLSGFTYTRFGSAPSLWEVERRSSWLGLTKGYQNEAWQHLITVYRSAGRDEEARKAGIAHESDRLRRAGLPRHRRIGRRLLGWTIGHGYRPARAGLWAAAVIAIFAALVGRFPEMFMAEVGATEEAPQPAIYAIDRFIPIIDFGEAGLWLATGWMRWVDWTVVLLGWILSTLFVAGFTRVVRS